MAPTRLADRLELPREWQVDRGSSLPIAPSVHNVSYSDCLPMLGKLSKGRSLHAYAGAQSHGLSTKHLEPSLSVAVTISHGSACSLAHRYQQPSPDALNLDCLLGELSRDQSMYVRAGSRPRKLLITPSHTYCYPLKHDAHEYRKDLYALNYRNNDGVNKCHNPTNTRIHTQ